MGNSIDSKEYFENYFFQHILSSLKDGRYSDELDEYKDVFELKTAYHSRFKLKEYGMDTVGIILSGYAGDENNYKHYYEINYDKNSDVAVVELYDARKVYEMDNEKLLNFYSTSNPKSFAVELSADKVQEFSKQFSEYTEENESKFAKQAFVKKKNLELKDSFSKKDGSSFISCIKALEPDLKVSPSDVLTYARKECGMMRKKQFEFLTDPLKESWEVIVAIQCPEKNPIPGYSIKKETVLSGKLSDFDYELSKDEQHVYLKKFDIEENADNFYPYIAEFKIESEPYLGTFAGDSCVVIDLSNWEDIYSMLFVLSLDSESSEQEDEIYHSGLDCDFKLLVYDDGQVAFSAEDLPIGLSIRDFTEYEEKIVFDKIERICEKTPEWSSLSDYIQGLSKVDVDVDEM